MIIGAASNNFGSAFKIPSTNETSKLIPAVIIFVSVPGSVIAIANDITASTPEDNKSGSFSAIPFTRLSNISLPLLNTESALSVIPDINVVIML